jgi:GT2 family glycosyltransferase
LIRDVRLKRPGLGESAGTAGELCGVDSTSCNQESFVSRTPTVTVVVPAHGASEDLWASLAAIRAASPAADEIIVADDGSPAALASDIAQRPDLAGITVVRHERKGGPGAARNLAARAARGDILFFVDADVVIPSDAIGRVARDLAERPEYCAVFGSYDETPARRDFLSQYKNLFHYYIHQIAEEEAGTFWAGCGAIRRDVFLAAGGFDADRYPLPSIEDIELGTRLRRAGHRILLDKKLHAKHLKRWDLRTLLVADIARRAIPWTQLILEQGSLPSDLNLRASHRASAALVALLVLALAALVWRPLRALGVIAACLAGVVLLNLDFYRFFLRLRGPWFAARVLPMHLLYYLYSGVTFVTLSIAHRLGLGGVRRARSAAFASGIAAGAGAATDSERAR